MTQAQYGIAPGIGRDCLSNETEDFITEVIDSVISSVVLRKSRSLGDVEEASCGHDPVHETDDEYPTGACEFFGSLRRTLGIYLGAPRSDIPTSQDPGFVPKDLATVASPTNFDQVEIDVFRMAVPLNVSFPREEIISRWVYEHEDGALVNVPRMSTKWMTDWLIEKKVMHPSFAPVWSWETPLLLPSGRQRTTKLQQVRSYFTGEFSTNADFFKSFRCSWSRSELHPCPSVLYVAAFSVHIKDSKRKEIEVQCAWSEDCKHHKDDISRGKDRKGRQNIDKGRTPNEICLQVVRSVDPIAIATGNHTYGSLNRETVRRQFVKRNDEYCRGSTVAGSIVETMKELADEDFKRDPGGAHQFYGSLHDMTLMSTGDLNSVSIYSSLAVRIAAEEIKGNENATAVIDCTGGLVSPIWISSAS